MQLKTEALPSNILMIPVCDNTSAAEGGTAFSKDPDRSVTRSLQQPREVGQVGAKQLSVQLRTGPTCPK